MFQSKHADHFAQGIELLKSFPTAHKQARDLLAKAYLKKPSSLQQSTIPIIFEGLKNLADKNKDYLALKEYFNWCMFGKPGLEPSITMAENLVVHLRQKDQKQAYKNLALHFDLQKQHHKACQYWIKLQELTEQQQDALFIEATARLVDGYINHGYFANSYEQVSAWLEQYYEHRNAMVEPKIDDSKLAQALLFTAHAIYKTQDKDNKIIKSLLAKAHNLGSLDSTANYLQFLFEIKEQKNGIQILNQVLPPEKVLNCFDLINQDGPIIIAKNKHLANIALIAANYYQPDNTSSSEHKHLFAAYLSYAALAGKNHAIYDLGYCLINGHSGFSKNPPLAIKWLSIIQEDNKFYPDALVTTGKFYLLMQEYDRAFNYFIKTLTSPHMNHSLLFQAYKAADSYLEVERYPEALTLYEHMLALKDKFGDDNPTIKAAKFYKARFHYHKLGNPKEISRHEIMTLLDESGIPETKYLKAEIFMADHEYEKVIEVLLPSLKHFADTSPAWMTAHIMLTHSYLMAKNMHKAIESYSIAAKKQSMIAGFNIFVMNFLWNEKDTRNPAEHGNFMRIFSHHPETYNKVLNSPFAISPFLFAASKPGAYSKIATTIKTLVDLHNITLSCFNDPEIQAISFQPFVVYARQKLEEEKVKAHSTSSTKQETLKDIDEAIALLQAL